ncbi:MAG TPA: hypothetical protein PLM72_11210, partial [Spirochaetota bacterium]|nr:hypothetical protein [Spirochaetota bacterium]
DKMKEKGSYDILKFDNFGGVILDIEQKDIIPERWNNRITKFDVSETELDHLKELILFLKTKNVRTVIAIPPQREGLTDKGELVIIREGTDKIEAVAQSAGAIFVNSFDQGSWPDSLFVDYCHLNKEGAEMFTELITESVTNYLKMEKP